MNLYVCYILETANDISSLSFDYETLSFFLELTPSLGFEGESINQLRKVKRMLTNLSISINTLIEQ